MYHTFVIKQEEPCEGRLSSTVLWEREGEIPSRDPIMKTTIKQLSHITTRVVVLAYMGEDTKNSIKTK